MKRLNPFLFLIVIMGLATLACSELTIVNQSPAAMRVMVRLPEGNGVDSQVIKTKSSLTFYSDSEGIYSVSVIPTEQAIEEMDYLRLHLKYVAYGIIQENTNYSISDAVKLLYELEAMMNNIQVAYCWGRLKEDEETIVVIGYDASSAKFVVTCP